MSGQWRSPLAARTALGDGIASALYVANYRFAMQGTDYLAAGASPSPGRTGGPGLNPQGTLGRCRPPASG